MFRNMGSCIYGKHENHLTLTCECQSCLFFTQHFNNSLVSAETCRFAFSCLTT